MRHRRERDIVEKTKRAIMLVVTQEGFSLSELAKIFGMSIDQMRNYLRGINLTVEQVQKFAKYK